MANSFESALATTAVTIAALTGVHQFDQAWQSWDAHRQPIMPMSPIGDGTPVHETQNDNGQHLIADGQVFLNKAVYKLTIDGKPFGKILYGCDGNTPVYQTERASGETDAMPASRNSIEITCLGGAFSRPTKDALLHPPLDAADQPVHSPRPELSLPG